MRILIACEESQAVTKEFRKLGHEGFEVKSFWNEKDGRRWKTYYYTSPLPEKGTRMGNLG